VIDGLYLFLKIYCCTVLPFVRLPTDTFRKRRKGEQIMKNQNLFLLIQRIFKDNPPVYTVRTGDIGFHLRPNSVIADEQDVRNGINAYENQLVCLEEIIQKHNDPPQFNVGPTSTLKNDKGAERLRF
jgi:hypothetical protein